MVRTEPNVVLAKLNQLFSILRLDQKDLIVLDALDLVAELIHLRPSLVELLAIVVRLKDRTCVGQELCLPYRDLVGMKLESFGQLRHRLELFERF